MTRRYSPPSSSRRRRCSAIADSPTAVRPVGEPGVGDHVHADEVALGPLGDACGPADQVVVPAGAPARATTTRSRVSHGARDPVALAVVLQRVVDAVGDPQQRQLAQRRQVAGAEVVAERGVDLVGGVDVAVGQPSTQRLGRHVDELDLVGGPHDAVGNGLALADPGDPLDDVVERVEVLDVDGGDDVDAGGEQLVDVLPPLVVARPGGVGVGELVDQDQLGPAAPGWRRGPSRSSALPRCVDLRRGTTSRSSDLLGRVSATVGLDDTRRRRRCRAPGGGGPR